MFKKINFKKIIIIFSFGLISRLLINNFFNINVFIDFLHPISIGYYLFMASFIVFINEYATYLPNFTQLFSITYNFIIKSFDLSKLNYKDFSPYNIIKMFKSSIRSLFNNNGKLYLYNDNDISIKDSKANKVNLFDPNDKENLVLYHKDKYGKYSGKYSANPGEYSETSKSSGKHNRTSNSSDSSSKSNLRRIKKNSSLSQEYNNGISPAEVWNTYNTAMNGTRSIPKLVDSKESIPVVFKGTYDEVGINSPNNSIHTQADYYQDNNGKYWIMPSTPKATNLSTPSNLSEADPTLYPSLPSQDNYNYIQTREDKVHSTYTNDTNHGTLGYKESLYDYENNNYSYENCNTNNNYTTSNDNYNTDVPYYRDNEGYLVHRQPVTSVNWSEKRHDVRRGMALQKALNTGDICISKQEIDLITKSKTGKFKLGFKLFGNNFENIEKVYIKYHDLTKRKLVWNLWEKGRGNYGTYQEFKSEFNPNTSIWQEIKSKTKSDVSQEVSDLLRKNKVFGKTQLEGRNTKTIGVTSTQDRLNKINAERYGADILENKKIKHHRIKPR